MKRIQTIVVTGFIFMSIFLAFMLNAVSDSTDGNTLYVGGEGDGNYTTIQSAIDAASIGDTIYVYNGTYYEHVFINKTVTFTGEDKLSTFIDGEKKILVTNYKEGVKPIYLDNQQIYFIRLIGDREITEFNRIQRSQDDILEEVKQKLNSWERTPGIRETLVTFNNHFRGFSPQDANEFRGEMGIQHRDFTTHLAKERKKQRSLADFSA